MNSPRDKDLGPLSRKHRLMAAALPCEDSPLAGSPSRSDRNGLGALVHCFICGSGVTPGKELLLQVTYHKERSPFFPFLQNQEPAPGAREVSPDGHALVCAVCHCFLTEQWNSFERSRTPIEKRMYWLKRPYQCDSRRVPQEWNMSYDVERRISVGSQNYEGGAESDFSSFSESDPEMDLVEKAGRDKNYRVAGKFVRENNRKNNIISVKKSPDSQRCPIGVYGASPKVESALAGRRAAKNMNNACQSELSSVKSQLRFPQEQCRFDSRIPDAPALDSRVIIRSRRWLEEGHVKHAEPRQIQSNCPSSRHASQLFRGEDKDYPGAVTGAKRKNTLGSSDEDEINITSDDERMFERTTPSRHQKPPDRTVSPKQSTQGADEYACYICGEELRHDSHFIVSVQKQERAQSEPFFPFLWLHSPPQGAVPISAAGTTLVCGRCHSSLMQQWQSFQLADVPVLQRLYVVPLNPSGASSHPPLQTSCDPVEHPSEHEVCFLCGQGCAHDMRVAYTQAGVSKSRGAMYFPFINLFPCPPNAQGVRSGRVHCCSVCHRILEDIWNAYRLTMNEDLITSVTSFLTRYHSTVAIERPASSQPHLKSANSHITSSFSVCYICGADLSAGQEHQLHVNPPGRCGEREPFFPFLTVHPPAPRAKPIDSTGLVAACTLCYHDLHAQWGKYENKGSHTVSNICSGTTPQLPSSPWARQYSCEAFVCFFCRQEQSRQGRLCAVTMARLPVFLYAPRSAHMLLVDDGRRLVIGACVECKAMVQVGQSGQQEEERQRATGAEKNETQVQPVPPQPRQKVITETPSGPSKDSDPESGPSHPAADLTPSRSKLLTSETETTERPPSSE
ncbi:uncharacterized protein LOC129457220 [Periophthalmus magnuspinnatus]|uniref:uncharacterized protein LOC129457220 n=1 Tax=Periophthalmus magnuspinnatus TaxID=409849 RepID=UPI00243681B7|nr:uncharacterized protein LOC129457220 [Periophthalmus magnuspinnatus]